jgi:hypothetical protein
MQENFSFPKNLLKYKFLDIIIITSFLIRKELKSRMINKNFS